ncbi:putative serine/threonine protein kinase [Saccharomycopsis crataegensis]|uniref:Serine/threonine protein kinase n=1 Tax=Saccharomycopsis crataegensis TaxID=43959 RepID=A0AAV5QK31_9ASCO|nr:putative serine/threonine protein kinase [Saccharomycopsis crataegensis]
MLLTDNLRLLKKIGSGAYGLVYLVEDCLTHKKYALKVISKLTNNKSYNNNGKVNNKPSIQLEENINALLSKPHLCSQIAELNLQTIKQVGHNYHYLKEISIHLKVNDHPNVVTIHKVYHYKEYLFILMDYYPHGDLFGTIVDEKVFQTNPTLIKSIFLQLLSVIRYCHELKVYHCDIKPENILISEDYSKIAITDFGLAVQSEYVADSLCCGSSYYMAPERLLGTVHQHHNYYPTAAGDLWSLGIILINLTCIRNPWMKASVSDETFGIYLNKPEILLKILPISKELFFILTNYLLVKNPYKRSTNNLPIVRTLVGNCKSFTKEGPLSRCEIFTTSSSSSCTTGDDSYPSSSCCSITSASTKRSYDCLSYNTNSSSSSTTTSPSKRLSSNISSTSTASLSSISSSSDVASNEISRTSSSSSASIESLLDNCITGAINNKNQKRLTSNKFGICINIKPKFQIQHHLHKPFQSNNNINPKVVDNFEGIDALIDYEFSFAAGKQYHHSNNSLFSYKK